MNLSSKAYDEFLRKCLYPCVRVRVGSSGGSGTVIWSTEEDGTFVLTCEHVISSAVMIKDEWSPVLQRMVKRDVKAPVQVEFFKYSFRDRAVGGETVEAEIIAYDKNEDIAVLRLKDEKVRECIAELQEEPLDMLFFDEVITVGCALGHPPVATVGNICGFNDVIDNRDYVLTTAPSVFGDSGGAVYLTKNWKLIGMPARISVVIVGFSGTPITHMSYGVPFWRIRQFFIDNYLLFLVGEKISYSECMKKLEERRKLSEIEMALNDLKNK